MAAAVAAAEIQAAVLEVNKNGICIYPLISPELKHFKYVNEPLLVRRGSFFTGKYIIFLLRLVSCAFLIFQAFERLAGQYLYKLRQSYRLPGR